MTHEWRRGEYAISTDRARLQLERIHDFLRRSYWAAERPVETIRRSLERSLCFGLYHEEMQVGFARVVTDGATFAWLGDVFVDEEHRGRGLGRWLTETVVAHPELQGLRLWMLATRDAHGLYRRVGFTELERPEHWMERRRAEG